MRIMRDRRSRAVGRCRYILLMWLLMLVILAPALQAQSRVNSAGAYFSSKDNYQHALVATNDGALREIYFDPLRGVFQDELGCFGKIVAISAFFTPDDGFQHAIVGTDDGSIREVFFDPS